MVLNLLSTASMVRMGRVYDNWMVSVALTNRKLEQRGVGILEEVTGVSASRAKHTLRLAGHNLPTALVMLQTGASANEARRRLAKTGGNVRKALSESNGSAKRAAMKTRG